METIAIVDRTTRQPGCKYCGHLDGHIVTKSGQDCVYCCACNRHQYNAPKTETGREVRSVSTTHAAIRPKQRARIFQRANGRCEICGKPSASCVNGLQVGHLLSVDSGHEQGLSDEIINGDDNLIAECDECNLGHGKAPLPIRLFIALLCAHYKITSSSDNQ